MKRIILILTLLFSVLVFAQPGSIDLTFNPSDFGFGNNIGADNGVLNSAIQSDGKIILVGDFTNFNGIITNRIVRLNTDGSIDDSFNIGSGANQRIRAIAIQSDGKIIIGGDFTTFNSVSKNSIVRLNIDGSIDDSFNIGSGFYQLNNSTEVLQILILSNEKIIVNGNFISFNGTSRYNFAQLNNDGTIDTSFNTSFNANNCNAILAIAVQSNGKLIIGGSLIYGGRNNIVRLNSDGSIDNTFNTTTTTFVGANDAVGTIYALQGGKILIGGNFTQYNGTPRNYAARLNSDGSLDTTFNLGISDFSNAFGITKIQNDGKMIIQKSSTFIYNGVSINYIGRLNSDFTIDNSFNVGSGIASTNEGIYTLSIQSDGKYIVGGTFNSFSGYLKSKILRLNIDGSVDNSFNTGTGASGIVRTTNIQPDGKIITGGEFSAFNGNISEKLCRLNTDGLFDATFSVGTGANGVLQSVLNQSDGKIIIVGDFTSYNGTTRNRIARLNSDGTIDTSFNPGTGANGLIRTLNIQPDGKILIGGNFTSYNGTTIYRIARLNTTGSLDTSFNSGISGPNADVLSTLVQNDGKIIISGFFTSYNGIQKNGILRLNVNGSIDGTFAVVQGANSSILSTSLQSDGKIIIGGNFTSYNGTLRNKIARLNTDGTIDNSFNPGNGVQGSVNSYVNTISLQNNGKIIIGGNFSLFNGNARNNIVRLNTNGTIDSTFNIGNGANGEVRATSIQSDGKIIIGGDFTAFNGIGRNRIARINGDTALSSISFEKGILNIYPNPSNGIYTLQCDDKNDAKSISIYTILGQKIYDSLISSNETTLDISNQPKGVYLYKVFEEEGETKSGKLVIE